MSSMWNGSGDMRDLPLAGASHRRYFKPEARGQERKVLEESHRQFEITKKMKSVSQMPHT